MSDEIFFDGVRYISAGEAAGMVGFTRDYVARLCKDEKLQAKRVGKQWYVHPTGIKEFSVKQEYARSKRREELSEIRRSEYNGAKTSSTRVQYKEAPTVSHNGATVRDAFRSVATQLPHFAHVRAAQVLTSAPLHAASLKAHASAQVVPPALELFQKFIAITVAILFTAGTFVLVDAQYARITERSSAGSAAMARAVHDTLVAAAANPAGTFSAAFQNFAKVFNSNIDSFVYGVMFPRSLASDSRAKVAVRVSPLTHNAYTTNTYVNPVEREYVTEYIVSSAGGITQESLDEQLTILEEKFVSRTLFDTQVDATHRSIENLDRSSSDSSGGGSSSIATPIAVTDGGTGISSAPTYGQVLLGNSSGGYDLVATSSLGISGSGGSSASSTLLADNNTFSGTNIFSSTITGAVSGNAGTATILQTARNINGTSFNGSADITITAASSTLLANNNTWTGVNIFSANVTLTNATSSNFAITNITSALPLAAADGSLQEYAGTSCTNQFVRSLNGAGVATCASVQDEDLNLSDITLADFTNDADFVKWANATSSLWRSAGLISSASSTIGGGAQATGLTISGGATTTGYLVVQGSATSTFADGLTTSKGANVGGYLFGANLTTCTGGNKLTWSNGSFNCDIDSTGGGSGGGSWSTTTSQVAGQLVNYSNNSSDIIAIGSSATTSAEYWFDPNAGIAFFSGNVGLGLTSPGTRLDVLGIASSTNLFVNTTATTTNLTITNLTNALLSTNALGQVGATTSIGTNLLTGSLGTVNGTTLNRGDSITITAASSTLLANNNTWTGVNIFSANVTLTNATSSNFAITNITSALPLAAADGSLQEYAGTSCTNQFVRSLNGAGVATCASVQDEDLNLSDITLADFTNDAGFAAYAFTTTTHFGTTTSATSTPLYLRGSRFSLFASSTSVFDNASTTLLSIGVDLISDIDGDALELTAAGVLNVNDVTAAMLASADFGDLTCNGTTCSFDADTVSDSEIDYSTVTLADFTNDADFVKWANATSSLWQSSGLLSTASSTIGAGTQATGLTVYGGATTTGFLVVQGSATSTFAAGISSTYLNITGTSATSTFARGIDLAGGCYAIAGVCVGGSGSGSLFTDGGNTTYLTATNDTLGIGTTTAWSKLAIYGDLFLEGSSRYLNFGTATGTSGYGFRDNSGVIEFKNSGGTWQGVTTATSGPSFFVHRNGSNQTVSAATFTVIDWTTETFDTNNNLDLSTDRFTPTVPGKYIVTVAAYCSHTSATSCSVSIRKNGSTSIVQIESSESATAVQEMATGIVDMNGVTDYLEGLVYNTNGTTILGNAVYTYFTGALIAPVNSNNAAGWTNDGIASYLLDNADKVGVGTSTPWAKLAVQTDAGQTNAAFEVASSSFATKFLSVSGTGFGTTTVTGLTVNGSATSTSNVGFNLSGGCFAVNGICVGTSGSSASSTLLADNNTFSGTNIFSNTITGAVSGNAGTATILQTARNINGTSFNGSADITITAASSTLLANNNTWTGANIFSANVTLTNATSSNFAITNITSALPLAAADGSLQEYAGTSCTNQFVRSLNGAGVSTCASVQDEDLNLSDITLADFTNDAGFAAYSFTTTTHFGTTTSATSTPLYLRGSRFSLFASSTSVFDNASTTLLSIGVDLISDIDGDALELTAAGVLNVNDLTAAMLASADFGEFTCNGTTCSFDADTVSDSEIDYSTVTLADFTNDADFVKWANATSSLWRSTGLLSTASSTIGAGAQDTGLTVYGGATTTGFLVVQGSATSTFAAGLQSAYLNITGTSATSTFARGIDLAGGCFSIAGECVGGSVGSGDITAVGDIASGAAFTSGTPGGELYFSDNGFLGLGSGAARIEFDDLTIDEVNILGANVGIGTSSPYAKLAVWGDGTGTGTLFELVNNASTTVARFLDNGTGYFLGNIGIGTTSPYRKLSLTDAVSTAQVSIAYDGTRYTELLTNSVGDLTVNPQGDDAFLNDDNLWVCTGGSCPSSNPTGTGNLVVENKEGIGTTTPDSKLVIETQDATTDFLRVASSTAQSLLVFDERGYLGIGTSTPTQQLSIANKLFVANGTPASAGTATSTFMGDVLITGKLDVSTIDPVYTIDGVKYATYGHSTVGVKEEAIAIVGVTKKSWLFGKYEYTIDFDELEEGSDLWLFYQVSDFGAGWNNLAVSATAGFDGTVSYKKNDTENTLTLISSAPGEVSLRLIADRFDAAEWPNLRPDQEEGFKGFEISAKK